MSKGKTGVILVAACMALQLAVAEKIVISGIVESSKGHAAMINGRLYRINDTLADGKITAITLEGVTVSRNGNLQVYKVSDCEATTRVSNSKPKGDGIKSWFKGFGRKPKEQAAPKKKKSLFSKKQESSSSTLKLPAGIGESTLSEKMHWADRLLEHEQRAFSEFKRSRFSSSQTPDEFLKAMEAWNKMSRRYTAQFSSLKLPCNSKSSSYQSWKKRYMDRTKTIRQTQVAEIQAAAERAGLECI